MTQVVRCVAFLTLSVSYGVEGIPVSQPPLGSRPAVETKIAGKVTAKDSGRPLRQAIIRVSTKGGTQVAATLTNANGRFEINDLSVAKYTVTAIKAPFVSLAFGQETESDMATDLDLAQTPIVENVNFSLTRGGVIMGTVLDELGEPYLGARVTSYRVRYVRGRKQLVVSGSVTCDDLGQFRLYGLSSGDYTIAAAPRVRSGDFGALDFGYAVTFAPGTADSSEASSISLAAGADASVQIVLVQARVARVEGVVVDTGGVPHGGGVVNLTDQLTNANAGTAEIDGIGHFSLSGVPPGSYYLKTDLTGRSADGSRQLVRVPISVRGQDIVGMRLAPLPYVRFEGQVEVDPLAQSVPREFRIGVDVVWLGDSGLTEARPSPIPLESNRKFSFRTFAGRARLAVTGLPEGWSVRAVRLGQSDVTDGADFVNPTSTYKLTIEITDRFPRVVATVVDNRGRPAHDHSLLVFAQDPTLWGWNSRHVVLGEHSKDGATTELGSLPPGRYYAVALPRLRDDQWADSDFLDSMRARATMVNLSEGEIRSLKLVIEPAR